MTSLYTTPEQGRWAEFKAHQIQVRQAWARKTFAQYTVGCQRRRRDHGLPGQTKFSQNLGQQSRLKSWTEYQAFLLEKQDSLERGMDAAMAKVGEHADQPELTQLNLRFLRSDAGAMETYLRWVEGRRRMLESQDPSIAESSKRKRADEENEEEVVSLQRRKV